MSSSLSDVEDQSVSANACFHYIPSKSDNDQLLHNPNPDSSFYVIKNTQQSSPFPSSTTTVSRPGNARTLFTIIPPMPQDPPPKNNVRCQLIFILHITSLVFVLLMHETNTTVIQTVNTKSKIVIFSLNYPDSNIPLGSTFFILLNLY